MYKNQKILEELNQDYQQLFNKRAVILSFEDFLERVKANPERLTRNSAQYLKDTFDYFGAKEGTWLDDGVGSFNLFDRKTEKGAAIVGCSKTQQEIYKIICSFVQQGSSNKLIMLHGPNGSAKTSIIESIVQAMQTYSESDEGAVYRFNWVFPVEKLMDLKTAGETGPIGFSGTLDKDKVKKYDSFALLDEDRIASRLSSEFKDNPLYLIPMPYRKTILTKWVAEAKGIPESEVELPPHILLSGLSKKNQLIFENLLTAYGGNIDKVLRHVQVERFFYSRQYRVGFASIEPQMHVDAVEKQLTMDKNLSNIPSILQNIRFHEIMGEVVEANRGILEFSDMLKRPIESFKYLLTSVERGTLHLPTSTMNLDIVFFATTNEQHLDAFKNIPDFASFRSRFEFVTVPYLLLPSKEIKIYEVDKKSLSKSKKIAPHAIESLCTWAVLTRLKQPISDNYDSEHRSLIVKLDPLSKLKLYEGHSLDPIFKPSEEAILKEMRRYIMAEFSDTPIYEGRFGASPRELRMLLYKAIQNPKYTTLTPMAIFDELEKLVKDSTIYEFLQFEPRDQYHDAYQFIDMVKQEFINIFEKELVQAMNLVEDAEYDKQLQRYIEHAVAFVKKEKVYNPNTSSHEEPSTIIMEEVEKIIEISEPAEQHREALLAKVASYKLEHKNANINLSVIFEDYLKKIQNHYYKEHKKIVDDNKKEMLRLNTTTTASQSKATSLAQQTFTQLEQRFGYDPISTKECLKFLMRS